MADAVIDEATCTRVVVRNLPRQTTAEELGKLFSAVGAVVETPFVSENRRLKGRFGFVNYGTHAHAVAAISKFNGHVMDGQHLEGGLSVELATRPGSSKKSTTTSPSSGAAGAGGAADGAAKKKRTRRGRGEEGGAAAAAGGGGDAPQQQRGRAPREPQQPREPQPEPEPSNRVFIRNLPRTTTAEELSALLGLKTEAFISNNRRLSGRFAFVEFESTAAAAKAIEKFNGHVLGEQGKEGGLFLQFAREATPSAGGGGAGASGASGAGGGRRQRGAGRRSSQDGAAAGSSSERAPRQRKPRAPRAEREPVSTEPAPPAPRLFVSNLPTNYDTEQLVALMSKAGKISDECFVSSNARLNGRFGFVLFENVAAATKAIDMFSGLQLENQGREGGLVVQYAREGKGLPPAAGGGAAAAGGSPSAGGGGGRGPRRGRGEGGGAAAGGAAASATPAAPPKPSPRVFVSNIPRDYTAEQVQALFAHSGKIVGDVFVSENRQLSGKFGFVNFETTEQATAAIAKLNGHTLEGQGREGGLIVQYATSKGQN